jgi:phosphatidylinositol alpha 1,6-mannosyltransferase
VLAAMVAALRDDPVSLRAAADRARPSVQGRTWGRIGDELIDHLQRLRARVPA